MHTANALSSRLSARDPPLHLYFTAVPPARQYDVCPTVLPTLGAALGYTGAIEGAIIAIIAFLLKVRVRVRVRFSLALTLPLTVTLTKLFPLKPKLAKKSLDGLDDASTGKADIPLKNTNGKPATASV